MPGVPSGGSAVPDTAILGHLATAWHFFGSLCAMTEEESWEWLHLSPLRASETMVPNDTRPLNPHAFLPLINMVTLCFLKMVLNHAG